MMAQSHAAEIKLLRGGDSRWRDAHGRQGSPGCVLSSCAKGTAADSQSFARIDVSSVQYVALGISGGETCRLLNKSVAPLSSSAPVPLNCCSRLRTSYLTVPGPGP
jgi:hypothetical protein